MNENVEVRFSRLERAPAYKTVSDAHSRHHRGAIADRLPSEENRRAVRRQSLHGNHSPFFSPRKIALCSLSGNTELAVVLCNDTMALLPDRLHDKQDSPRG